MMKLLAGSGNAICLALLALGSISCGRESETPLPSASLASAPGSEDEITGFDVAAGADGSLHLAWSETTGLYGARGHSRILYRRGDGNPLRWEAPIVVADRRMGKPQVVVAHDGVHVIAGGRLHHWLLQERGGAAVDLGDLLPPGAATADAFDATAIDGGLMVLFLTADRRKQSQGVYSLRWAGGGADVAFIAPLAQGAQVHPQPRLLPGEHGQLLAVWPSNGADTNWDESIGAAASQSTGHVFAARSFDGGRSWRPYELVGTVPQGRVHAVAIGGTEDQPTVFYGGTTLLASRRQGHAWSPPLVISRHRIEERSGSAIAAAHCGGSAAVAWTDDRYRGTDRRWWKPLGGWPWSDAPDWINNDVFLMPTKGSVLRLSPAGSMTHGVAIVRRNGELVLFRAGRAQVRKAPNDAQARPEIQQLRVPCG